MASEHALEARANLPIFRRLISSTLGRPLHIHPSDIGTVRPEGTQMLKQDISSLHVRLLNGEQRDLTWSIDGHDVDRPR